MSDIEPEFKASVSTIWTSFCFLDGEPARVKIIKGQAILRIFGFDAPVPGVFEDGDIQGVITAHQKQLADIDTAIAALPSGWVPTSRCDECPELIPITDEELEEQIKQYEKRGEVISLKTGKTI